jgi:hypothetical protein
MWVGKDMREGTTKVIAFSPCGVTEFGAGVKSRDGDGFWCAWRDMPQFDPCVHVVLVADAVNAYVGDVGVCE